MTTRQNLFPFLRYADAPAAIEWLCHTFGFVEGLNVPGPGGIVAHAELSLGSGVVMVGSMKDDTLGMKTPRELGAVNGGIYVFVEDVDAHYDRARGAGAEIVRELAETDHGSREYVARDLEDHLWGFGTYRPAEPPA